MKKIILTQNGERYSECGYVFSLLLGVLLTYCNCSLFLILLFQNFSVSLIKGFIDSLRGVTVLLYLDKEINERALSRSPLTEFENTKNKQKQPKVKQ